MSVIAAGAALSSSATVKRATRATTEAREHDAYLADLPTSFDFFTQRYFHHYRVVSCKGVEGNDCRLLLHSNGLVVLCLDPAHRALADHTTNPVTLVQFGSGRAVKRPTAGPIRVVGKRKRNALVCQADTKLCTVTLAQGQTYSIPACVNGFVLELNETLLTSPWLLARAPLVEGYVAIISPSTRNEWSVFDKVWSATAGEAGGGGADEGD